MTLRPLSSSPDIRVPRRVRALACASLLLAAGLPGCAGHGRYTKDHINTAQEKLSLMKSGTEWKMAQQQFLAGELDKAIKSVDNSITLNPKVCKAHVLRGRILIEKGELEAARAALLEAETIDATSVEAQYYMGIIHERFSQHAEALERYRNGLELDKSNAQCLIAGAEMLVQLGRTDEAEALLTERREDFPYNPAVRQALGHIATLRGDHAKAVELFNDARLLAPDDAAVLEDLARAQLDARDFAQAEFNLARLLDMSKDRTRRDLVRLRAQCLMELDRPVEARTALLELTADKEGAADAGAWIELGEAAAVLNDQARLKIAASRAIALAPERPEGHVLRAMLLKRRGDLPGALASLDTAVSLSPNDPCPLILRGVIQTDMGKAPAARESFSAALGVDPDNGAAKALLAGVTEGGD